METRQEGDHLGANTAQSSSAQSSNDLNFGSARSDYGSLAYGGRLDAQGMEESDEENLRRGEAFASRGDGQSDAQSCGMSWNSALILLGGVGLGAALMYMLDPDQGRRRRALARDKIVSASNKTGKAIGKKSRDLRNRAQGVIAETSKMLGVRGERNRDQQGTGGVSVTGV